MEEMKGYAFTRTLDTSCENAISKVTEALKQEGFGVLTEIDVKETLKKRLGVDFRKYTILGACNPPYAHRTLQTDLEVGLLLPCNVTVHETDDQKTCVSAINPVSALQVIKSREPLKIAEEVSEKLKKSVTKSLRADSKRPENPSWKINESQSFEPRERGMQ